LFIYGGILAVTTRERRLAEFSTGIPTESLALTLLCEDHVGTYVLPYPCHWNGSAWTNKSTGETIEATVVGWRLWVAYTQPVRHSKK
jgi:hypothetical protein